MRQKVDHLCLQLFTQLRVMLVRMYAWLALFDLRNIQTLCLLLTNLEMYLKEREINNSLQA